MERIEFDFCGNTSGIVSLYAIPPSAVESITHNYKEDTTRLNLINTDAIMEIYCTEDTLLFTEEKEQTNAGAPYNPVITGITPKLQPINKKNLSLLETGYWLVLFIDNNGFVRLAGDLENHLIFNREQTTGQGAGRNQTEFTLSGYQTHSTYFIDPSTISFI
jgi:hypothetical protein